MSFKPAPFAGDNDILVQAKPPACDPVTYLTLLEYQLTDERLPLLHDILQDEDLTSEIGWDLVKTLLKFVPGSRQCLNDVARLGNPREVILSIAQALEKLRGLMQDEPAGDDGDNSAAEGDDIPDEDTIILRYEILLEMLPILQSRLVSKSPSRFLGSALEAVLTTFAEIPTSRAATATMNYIGGISGILRPPPPPRNESANSRLGVSSAATGFRAGDPENERPSGAVITGQREVTKRLARFALLEASKIFITGFEEEVPSMNWALRVEESQDPRDLTPQMQPLSAIQAFQAISELKERDAVFNNVLNLACDFGINDQELINVLSKPENEQGDMLSFETIPQNPNEISFERHGCLLLLAARVARWKLQGIGPPPAIPIDNLAAIFSNFRDEYMQSAARGASRESTLIDSLLTLVAGTVETLNEPSWEMADDTYEALVKNVTICTLSGLYRERLSARRIAAAAFSASSKPQQRYDLLCKLLSSEDEKDALLKESAIGWFKDELMKSIKPGGKQTHSLLIDTSELSRIIRITFSNLPVSPPLLTDSLTQQKSLLMWMIFLRKALPAYLAYINFYHFLSRSKAVLERVPLKDEIHQNAMKEVFEPIRCVLRQVVADRSELEEAETEAWSIFITQCKGGIDIALGLIDQIEYWGAH
ncbi:hypothetical protein KEM54_003721 [Ascosphaera aggregata]|nr:hypothetical protein KEM54_003721 [Ascosphaera aggregata]